MSCWAALCTTFALAMPVAPSPPDTVEGSGWKLLSLDLDVTVLPAEKTLRFSGRARLRLERDSSLGPALGMNTRRPVLRFTRATAAGATVVLNDSIPGDSAARVLRLRLAQPARRGAEIETAFEYEMVGTSSQLLVQDSVALASWVENWYPAPLTEDGFTQTAASAPGVTRFHLPQGLARGLQRHPRHQAGQAERGRLDRHPARRPLLRRGAVHRGRRAHRRPRRRHVSADDPARRRPHAGAHAEPSAHGDGAPLRSVSLPELSGGGGAGVVGDLGGVVRAGLHHGPLVHVRRARRESPALRA